MDYGAILHRSWELTKKHKWLWVYGLVLAVLVLIVVILWAAIGAWSKGKENMPFYQSVIEDIKAEFTQEKNSSSQVVEEVEPSAIPTFSPTPLPTSSQAVRPTVLPTKKPVTFGETTLMMTVVKEGNQPVENAHLILRNAEDLSFIGEGYTDRYGNFGFGKLTATSYRIQAGLGNDLSFQKTVTVTLGQANTATVELLYNTQVTISGYVRFNDGSPIGGVQLSVGNDHWCNGARVSTNNEGKYEAQVSGPGDYCVEIEKMDWSGVNTTNEGDFKKGFKIESASGATVDFSLSRK